MTTTINTTQGSRYRGFTITCVDQVSGAAVDLTGATITGRLIINGTARAVDGTLGPGTLASGIVQWAPGANDVGTAGPHELQIIATIGGLALKTFRCRFNVEAAI